MKTIILLGAPGAGKGTVADLIAQRSAYTHVSTGDMLREAVKAGSPVGLQARSYMEAGELVPDNVIMGIVRERLAGGAPAAHYMFDGFPRTDQQARLLDETLAACQSRVDKVFLLEVSRELLIDRLAGRRICRGCGAVYHIHNMPPQKAGVCDQCGGGDIYQRPDDSEDTVQNRLEVFKKQTASLIDYYERRGVLVRVDASRDKVATCDTIVGLLP